jgi:SH3-like domain-containing protein
MEPDYMMRDSLIRRCRNLNAMEYVQAGLGAMVLLAVISAHGLSAQEKQSQSTVKLGASGLQVPRFVSLKSNRVNVRKGPSTDHAVAWVFSRAGLPVEVIAEFEHWRQIRDSEGSEGWIFHALLSGRRTALILPWVKERKAIALLDDASTGADPVAQLEPGVLGSVHQCDGTWCNFTVGKYTGWIEQERLWGVYRSEKVK